MDQKKIFSDLTIQDFHSYPLWTWEEDTEFVNPLTDFDTIPNDTDAVFVICEITTNSNDTIVGVVTVRVGDQEVYVISFPDESGKLIDVPLQPILKKTKDFQLKKLCTIMNKNLEDIFPVNFRTSFRFSDGKPLRGKIFI